VYNDSIPLTARKKKKLIRQRGVGWHDLERKEKGKEYIFFLRNMYLRHGSV
jgi:hypothetical protein